VSAATDDATIASISTPVRSTAFTVLVTTIVPVSRPPRIDRRLGKRDRVGQRDQVRTFFLAAAIPAIRASDEHVALHHPPRRDRIDRLPSS